MASSTRGDSKVPESVQKKVPQDVQEAIPDQVHIFEFQILTSFF